MELEQEKRQIINQICERHPSAGVNRGWSEYVGGMRDTGQWFPYKMLDASLGALKAFLSHLIEEENKPVIPLTEEEIADSKKINIVDGHWYTELSRKQTNALYSSIFHKAFFRT